MEEMYVDIWLTDREFMKQTIFNAKKFDFTKAVVYNQRLVVRHFMNCSVGARTEYFSLAD